MSRQLDLATEKREATRQLEVVKSLEFALAGAIEFQGGQLRGFSMRYSEFDCLMTLRAQFEQKWVVAFLSSETMIGCILSAQRKVSHNAIRWEPDQYAPDEG